MSLVNERTYMGKDELHPHHTLFPTFSFLVQISKLEKHEVRHYGHSVLDLQPLIGKAGIRFVIDYSIGNFKVRFNA